eukprot:PhM_4_TR17448/c1_g1_i1/m.88773
MLGGNSAVDYVIPSRRELIPQGKCATQLPTVAGNRFSIPVSIIDVKPLRPLVVDASKRTPILYTSELVLNSWHAGRYIEGVLSSFSNRSGVMHRDICLCCRHCCD